MPIKVRRENLLFSDRKTSPQDAYPGTASPTDAVNKESTDFDSVQVSDRFPKSTGSLLDLLNTALLYMYLNLTLNPSVPSPQRECNTNDSLKLRTRACRY